MKDEPSKANAVRRFLSAVFNFGIDRQLISIDNNPFAVLAPFEIHPHRWMLTDEQLNRLKEVLWKRIETKPFHAGCCLMAIETGLSEDQLRTVDWEDCELESGFFWLGESESFLIPLSEDALRVLNLLLPLVDPDPHPMGAVFLGRRYDEALTRLHDFFKDCCAEAGVPTLQFRGLRTTFVFNAGRKDVAFEELGEMLGLKNKQHLENHYRALWEQGVSAQQRTGPKG